jgi:putative tryptophan/tyrosine transport system substrate-binding protein
MKRREFITLLGGTIVWPLTAHAQQTSKLPIVGYLAAQSEAADRPRRAAFGQRLAELGWVEGSNVKVEYRWSDGVIARVDEIMPEFIHLPVDVIVIGGDSYVLAAKRATSTIPIVFPAVGDPVGHGLVASLARPGGNATGLSLQLPDTAGKRLELLREIVPGLHRVAILFNAADPIKVNAELGAAQAAAHALNLDPIGSEIRPGEDITAAIDQLKGRAEALYVCTDPLANSIAARINALALAARLPVVHSFRINAAPGGLISYGPDILDLYRRAAEPVDKILRGTKPSDIPIEQPIKFELFINLKTAKALGLTMPPSVLALANEVIE